MKDEPRGAAMKTAGQAKADHDAVLSFNVGGTIIAVLRSTLLRHAPNSTFATGFSGRWQKNDTDQDGNIMLVRGVARCESNVLYCVIGFTIY